MRTAVPALAFATFVIVGCASPSESGDVRAAEATVEMFEKVNLEWGLNLASRETQILARLCQMLVAREISATWTRSSGWKRRTAKYRHAR
jgi:hypothetical protein